MFAEIEGQIKNLTESVSQIRNEIEQIIRDTKDFYHKKTEARRQYDEDIDRGDKAAANKTLDSIKNFADSYEKKLQELQTVPDQISALDSPDRQLQQSATNMRRKIEEELKKFQQESRDCEGLIYRVQSTHRDICELKQRAEQLIKDNL